ncbi:MAG: ATP-binding protein [Solirubrobacteraceae bacterium]
MAEPPARSPGPGRGSGGSRGRRSDSGSANPSFAPVAGPPPTEGRPRNVDGRPAKARRLPRTLAAIRRRTTQKYGALAVIGGLLITIGIVAAVVGAHQVAVNDAQTSRLTFQRTAAQVATNVQLAFQHYQDLELAAGAFVADHSNPTEAQFKTWGRAVDVQTRYPDLNSVGWIVMVPAPALAAFAHEVEASSVAPLPTGSFTIQPPGTRPYYCLTQLALNTNPMFAPPADFDYCPSNPLLAARDSGRATATSSLITGGLPLLAFVAPIYRAGTHPATESARRQAFIGWTYLGMLPDYLLNYALSEHPHMSLALRRTAGGAQYQFASTSTPPRHAAEASVSLLDGSTLEIYGAIDRGGMLSDGNALDVLLGGLTLCLLLAGLLYVLGKTRVRALAQVREQTRELSEEAERIAIARDEAVEASNAKSVFVATVSHELRTPLTGVIGTTELLLETDLQDEQKDYAEIIRSSSEGLLLVINDILDYSKIEAGKLELDIASFALPEMIAESCATLLPTAREKGVRLVVEAASDLPAWLRGDAGRLRQVVINLLSNAVKFTDGGRVTVHVAATPGDDGVVLRIEVTDTGIGIDEATLARLFQPFTQADNSTARKYGGTGLGLTIAAQLVEMMGGTIGAHSTPGVGSTFWFEVPLAAAEDQEPSAASHALLNFSALGERDAEGKLTDAAPLVLVAEDNPVNQMLSVRLLDKCGYRAEVVANGYEALEAIEHTAYAAILMDCQMPEMDGYEATRELRRREHPPQHMPVIATTAHSMTKDREKCLDAGMDEYIAKPIHAADLRDALARAIAAETVEAPPSAIRPER